MNNQGTFSVFSVFGRTTKKGRWRVAVIKIVLGGGPFQDGTSIIYDQILHIFLFRFLHYRKFITSLLSPQCQRKIVPARVKQSRKALFKNLCARSEPNSVQTEGGRVLSTRGASGKALEVRREAGHCD